VSQYVALRLKIPRPVSCWLVSIKTTRFYTSHD